MGLVDDKRAEGGDYDLCVVGAGAAGLALAFAANLQGLSVLVVERGGKTGAPDSGKAHFIAGNAHDPLSHIARSGIGGTLDIWGRRCVPFDPEDFERNAEPDWPISYDEYARWVGPAAAWLRVPDAFVPGAPAGWTELNGVRADTSEALSPATLTADLRRQCREDSSAPHLLISAEAVALNWQGTSVVGVMLRHDGAIRHIRARHVVLTGGGLPSAQLLLAEAARHPGRLSGAAQLGRGYMGHLTGSIATLSFHDPIRARDFAYAIDATGTPWRRRLLTGAPEPRAAFWLESPDASDPDHRSGELSLKALLHGTPAGQMARHLANIASDPGGALATVAARWRQGAGAPNRLVPGLARYRVAYHAEHLRELRNRVRLAHLPGALDLPPLEITFGFGHATVSGVVAAHRKLAEALAASGMGALHLSGSDDQLLQKVTATARDGYHQIGLARMATDPERGVVDANCRVFGTDNLYVASSAVFPRSSQANPTLSIVAFALRLAKHLAVARATPESRREVA
ncbi:hypothetical protein OCH239_15260 [Roseivivax halodurans JCM 10272]|uniref:Glucose-methanol-choline oxidoreductase C-terminal domain-containing protein n=1 Tax=Roseivivax halodurans JCM 10272 TaxID=1449350 RepID=X7ECN8_9RHOB|nr:FAD-dependent oxidoreductase [Roseivivax halodurans]ETX12936.1 hypothetical protein OCH239_15260 [Roseivivax halodurans JCM 10272]